jgi:hypothetical protein
MTKNLGTNDRIARVIGGALILLCSVTAPLPLAVRAAGFGLSGVYLLFSAIAGTCFGYRLMGKSTCPLASRQ